MMIAVDATTRTVLDTRRASRHECPFSSRYATTSWHGWPHLAEGFERERGTFHRPTSLRGDQLSRSTASIRVANR